MKLIFGPTFNKLIEIIFIALGLLLTDYPIMCLKQ